MRNYKITYLKDSEERVTDVTAPTKDKAKNILCELLPSIKIIKTLLKR